MHGSVEAYLIGLNYLVFYLIELNTLIVSHYLIGSNPSIELEPDSPTLSNKVELVDWATSNRDDQNNMPCSY